MFTLLNLVLLYHLLLSEGNAKNLVIEGDILVTPKVANVIMTKGKGDGQKRGTRDSIKRWKYGIIPYKFSSAIDIELRKVIKEAFRVYKDISCVKFQKARPVDNDYIEFIKSDGCFSSIGRQGGRQTISLGDGCGTLNHVLHELMHSMGFFHEQSRADRDLYVKILWWNIADGAMRNFATYGHGGLETLDMEYDKKSILHYGNRAFTKNGEDTIEAIDDPSEKLGQQKLSTLDIIKINRVYNCWFSSWTK